MGGGSARAAQGPLNDPPAPAPAPGGSVSDGPARGGVCVPAIMDRRGSRTLASVKPRPNPNPPGRTTGAWTPVPYPGARRGRHAAMHGRDALVAGAAFIPPSSERALFCLGGGGAGTVWNRGPCA